MKDHELIKLFEKYKKDAITTALYSQFIEVSSSLDQINLLVETDPTYYGKIKEEAKLIKRKTISISLARFSEIENKRKINKYATAACFISLFCASIAFYQNYRQQANNSTMKTELFALLNEQIEQSSQEMLDKLQAKFNTKIDNSLNKIAEEKFRQEDVLISAKRHSIKK